MSSDKGAICRAPSALWRELTAAQQLATAQRALALIEGQVHGGFAGRDVDELRDAWRARETSRVGGRGEQLRPTADEVTPAAPAASIHARHTRGHDRPR